MNPQKKATYELLKAIRKRNGKIVNAQVILGTIESFGIREVDVEQDFGFSSLEELASHLFELLSDPQIVINGYPSKKTINGRSFLPLKKTKEAATSFKDFILGVFHLTPIFLQIAAIVFFGFSLWGYLHFDDLQSTAVVLGVILGLTGSGGFIQVLSRQMSFYKYQKDYRLMWNSFLVILKANLKVFLLGMGGLTLINFMLSLYPFRFLGILFIYGFAINFLLLVLAPFYTLRKRWVISIIIGIGTLISIVLFKHAVISIFLIHGFSIALCIGLSLLCLKIIFQNLIKNQEQTNYKSPERALSAYTNIRYFIYGTFLFGFIFIDRLLAWSATGKRELSFLIYYQKDYEIGMDLAILVFFLLAGALEYAISSFSRFLVFYQKNTALHDIYEFNQKMTRLYYRHLRILAINGVGTALLLYLITTQPWGYQWAFGESLSQISLVVCILGAIGYFFLTLGMLNVLYLFTLNQQQNSLTNFGIAIVINLATGLILSRLISFEYSVAGLLAGSLMFAVLTTSCVLRFFKNLDYHYYAAS